MTNGLECTGMLEFHWILQGIKTICAHTHTHTRAPTYTYSMPLLVRSHSSSGWWLCFQFSLDLAGVHSPLGTQTMSWLPCLNLLGAVGKCWGLDPIVHAEPGSCALKPSLAESSLFLYSVCSDCILLLSLAWKNSCALNRCLKNSPC